MSTPTAAARTRPVAPVPGRLDRIRAALAAFGAAVLGVMPHVLHHAGPLAGAAVLAGTTGRLLFGVIGLVAAVPMLRRLHRRTGSWRLPAGVLALMAAVFTFSSLVLGPALTGSDATGTTPKAPDVTQPAPSGHESHHS